MSGQQLSLGVEEFILAGKAYFTIQNPQTQKRFTYKVSSKQNKNVTTHFVSVLSGSNNETDYRYIGFIRARRAFIHGGTRAQVKADRLSVKAFDWFWRHRDNPSPAEIFHEGRCARCGKKLTTPESIESGYGPECLKKISMPKN